MKTSTLLALLYAELGYATISGNDFNKRQDLSALLGGFLGGGGGGGGGACRSYSMAGATGILGLTDSTKGSIGHAMSKKDFAVLGALGNGRYGKTSDPPGAAPRRAERPSEFYKGAKEVKVRYGPYLAPSMKYQNTQSCKWGMLESLYDTGVEKPCKGQCTILRQIGGLEYANGENANIDTGMWLHHMVHYNMGKTRWDPVGVNYGPRGSCVPIDGVNLPPVLGMGLPMRAATSNTERYFVTGNERVPFHFYKKRENGKESGYQLEADDKFFFLIELMNMNAEDKLVYITMKYDILDGPLPTGWEHVKTVFLDANECGSSEIESPKNMMGQYKTKFTVSSEPWTPTVEGEIVDAIGHLHDGGVMIDMDSGEGMMCKSEAVYSKSGFREDYISMAKSMKGMSGMGGMEVGKADEHGDVVALNHIAEMKGCGRSELSIKKMHKRQRWVTNGHYDYDLKSPEKDDGHFSEIMAISMILVAAPSHPKP